MKIRNRLLSLSLALFMLFSILPVTAQAAGLGTSNNPIKISTEAQLKDVKNGLDKHYVLAVDITLSGQWDPIGPSKNKAFTGTFDGNWHTISGLEISGSGHTYYGLFGYIDGAEICNLSLQNVNINAQYQYGSYVGALVGDASGNSKIENCFIQGSVSGPIQSSTGGLAGNVAGPTVQQCFVDVNVTSTAANAGAGGIAGSLSGAESRITNSYASGCVTGYYAGGLVGILSDSAVVESSYATGAVSSTSGGGGLVGMSSAGQVTDSYYDTETTGKSSSFGGTGKTTAEMQTPTAFPNWDTTIWNFESGKYPSLYYQRRHYSVTYDLNGGTGTVPIDSNTYVGFQNIIAADSDGLTPPEGKALKEWNTESDGSGFSYIAGRTFGMPGKDITLYAIWDTQYTVSYNLNTGTGPAPSSEQHFAGDTFAAASGTGMTAPDGKRFLQWNTSESGKGTAYNPGDFVDMPEGGLTLYAIWETSYIFTYDLNGGVGDAPEGGLYFEDDTFLAADYTGITPPDNMQFAEWNTSSGGDGGCYAPGDTVTMPAANLTLYAIWEELQDGSEEYPFLVNDFYDLYEVKDELDLHYRQTADITLPNPDFDYEDIEYLPGYSNWAPLGYEWNPDTESYCSNPFTGSYDGGGFTISGLTIDTGAFEYAGLFAYVAEGAELKNINLVDVKIASSFSHDTDPGCVGALAGHNEGTITACTTSGYLSGVSNFSVGGVAGFNVGTITDCTSSGYLSGGSYCVVGGIAGYNDGALATCTANGCLAGGEDSFVEGIAGLNDGTINSCTDNTTRAQVETLFFVEEDGIFYIGDPADGNEASDLDGWSYDSGNGVLTLDNLTWLTMSPQALVIVPDEDNNLTVYLAAGSENTLISLFNDCDSYSCGLEVEGNLFIDGTGTLLAQSVTSKGDDVDGIYVWGDLRINGGTITATASNALIGLGQSTGIYVGGAITISGGTVTATGSTQAVYGDDAVTINIAGGYKYWANTRASASGAAGPVGSTATPFVNSNIYKYIRITPGLQNEYTPTSPTLPDYNADVSDGGKMPVKVNTDTSNASLDLSALSERLGDGRNTVVVVPPISGVSSFTASLPSASLSGSGAGSLTLSTGVGSVTFPGNMLSGTGLMGNASITIGSADTSSLPESVQTAIGNRPLISLTLTMDGKPVEWANPDASVTISIPYTPTAEELLNPESIVIWYIDGRGNVVTIPSGRYDPTSGTVTFSTNHFSNYAVAYNSVSFNDVAADAWYNKPVGFLAARGITTGTGKGNYSPEAELTRGEFMVMLMRAYGISPDFSSGENFADAGNTYYTSYLKAAKALGISEGVGNNLFAPGKEITRQEMFVLLYNTLKHISQLPQRESNEKIDHFTDWGSINSWAKEALTLLVEAGIIRGSEGELRPFNTTTRAEMAQMLYNLMGK